MPVSEQVVVEVLGRVDSLEREMRRGGQTADRELSGIESRVRKFAGVIGGLFAGVSAAALVAGFLEIADASKTLDAQLRLATAGFGTFAQATDDVRRISADTRAGLQETASLYGNFARAGKDLGATQEDVARATETFSKALKISGADSNQAASATLQFGQALASGALRGDELNSVLEAAPRLTTLLTESMGKSKGEIKALGEAGELTSDKLLNALTNKKFTEGIDSEFRELPVTFGDAMTQVENAAIITFGAFDRGGQFSTALANFVTDGSDGFKQLEADAVSMGIAIRANIEGLAGAFGPIFDEARRFFEFVNGQSVKVDIGRDVDKSLGQIDSLTDWLANKSYLGQKLNGTSLDMSGSNLQGRYRADRDNADRRLRQQNGLTLPGPAGAALDAYQRAIKAGQAALAPKAGPASPKGGKSSGASAANKAEQDRLRAIRDQAAKERDASRLQDDITAAKAALAVATEDVLRYNLAQIDSEKVQRLDEFQKQAALGKLTAQELADRTASVNQLADLQKQRVQQIADENQRRDDLDRAQAANRDESDLLRAQQSLTDSRQARRDIELRLLDLAYEQEQAELEAVIASETASAAQKEIAEQRLRILGQLKAADAEGVNRSSASPLERKRQEVRETAANMGDAIESIEVDAVDRLADGLANASKEYIKLGGIAGDVINGIISDLVKLAVQQAILGATGQGGNFLGIKIPAFAKGTNSAPGGLALVGEDGPEVVNLPRGSKVIPNNMLNARAAASMAGVTATGSAARPIQQYVTNYYGPGAEEFWGEVDGRAARVARPIAARQANQSAGASYVAGQQSTPGTLNKYTQLKG